MKKNNNNVKTVKGAIVEMIISILVIFGTFAITIYDYSQSTSARFSSRIGFYFLILGLSFISFIHGVVMLIARPKKDNKHEYIDEESE